MRSILGQIPLCTAIIKSLREYNLKFFIADVKAAFVVSLVALPLSMALSIAVGLPPQHGLYTAIVAGFFAPLLGGSRFQVSGPTAAFIVIIAPIISEFGLRGIIWCQILAGIFLIILGITRTGRLINYIPYPVTTGFTAGIAIVIATISLKDLLGLDIGAMPDAFIDKVLVLVLNIGSFQPAEFSISMITILLILFSGKVIKIIPSPIIGIAVATLAAYFMQQYNIDIVTIGDRFLYITSGGNVLHGIPPYPPHMEIPGFSSSELFALPTIAELRKLIAPALIVAILAALESLLSATVADSLAGTKHDPNAELNAIGIVNILSGMFSGIPATGAIARTATLIHAGARSPLSSSMHAIFLLIFMISLSKYANFVPMSALAAILFITAYRMSHIRQVINILKYAPKNDKIVLGACLASTALIDMVVGVTIGVLLASILFMKRVSELTEIEAETATSLSRRLLAKVPDDTLLFRVQGALFFGTVEKAMDRTVLINSSIKKIILDLSKVSVIDITGIIAVKSIIDKSIQHGIKIYICGDGRILNKINNTLDAKQFKQVTYHETINEAIKVIQDKALALI